MEHIDPAAKAFMDAVLPPILEIFRSEISTLRSNGAEDEDIEEFLANAIEAFPGGPLDPVMGAYVVARLREAAGLQPAISNDP